LLFDHPKAKGAMNKLVLTAVLGAASLALQAPAVAQTTVKRTAAATPTFAFSNTSQTSGNTGNGGNNANNAPNNNPQVGGNSGNLPKLGNGCNASGNVPKKCKPSGS
jgi:hypothetical protein